MSRLFICEKKFQAKIYLDHLNEDDAIILCPTITSYLFDYPEKLTFSDLPYCDHTPSYKANKERNPEWLYCHHTLFLTQEKEIAHPVLLDYFNRALTTNRSDDSFKRAKSVIHDFIGSFDEIVFACDPDISGLRGFDFFFEKYLEVGNLAEFGQLHGAKITACIAKYGMDDKSIIRTISERSDFFENTSIHNIRLSYQKKDFFEYNYNLNSLLLLNKAYFLASGEYLNRILTKNHIQTLFLFADQQERKESIHFTMDKLFIGSPASRIEIVENLIITKMLHCEEKKPHYVGTYTITNLGQKFLSNLHRKVNDPHLAERLGKDTFDAHMPLDDFKLKYSKYLKVVFSKQKRHINREQN